MGGGGRYFSYSEWGVLAWVLVIALNGGEGAHLLQSHRK